MDEQLKWLEELQKVDLQLKETEEQLSALPAKLQSMKDDVARVETLLATERSRLDEAQRYREQLGEALKQDQDLLHKTKSKLQQVRNSKEYMAVQREFDTSRRLNNEREEEAAKLDRAIQDSKESMDQHDGELDELRNHVNAEEKDMQDKIRELEQLAVDQRAAREELSGKVRKNLLRKYDQIRRMRGGVAVVAAEQGVCTGCRMQLPPQLFNTLQRGNSIEQCPNCQRIVYFPDAVANAAAAGA